MSCCCNGFVSGDANAGGGIGGTPFIYTVVGDEPDLANLVITLPAALPTTDYSVFVEQQTFTNMLAHAVPSATKALGQFVLALSSDATAGDEFSILVLEN